jgi:hypothetical protein
VSEKVWIWIYRDFCCGRVNNDIIMEIFFLEVMGAAASIHGMFLMRIKQILYVMYHRCIT